MRSETLCQLVFGGKFLYQDGLGKTRAVPEKFAGRKNRKTVKKSQRVPGFVSDIGPSEFLSARASLPPSSEWFLLSQAITANLSNFK